MVLSLRDVHSRNASKRQLEVRRLEGRRLLKMAAQVIGSKGPDVGCCLNYPMAPTAPHPVLSRVRILDVVALWFAALPWLSSIKYLEGRKVQRAQMAYCYILLGHAQQQRAQNLG